MHPATREIVDYFRFNNSKDYCYNLKGYGYANIIYYINNLVEYEIITKLTCENGYKRRYSINTGLKKYEDIFTCNIKYHNRIDNLWYYKHNNNELAIDYYKINDNKIYNIRDYIIVNDIKNLRYYILYKRCILATIKKDNKTHPRLPGLLYGKHKSEYIRCLELMKKNKINTNNISVEGKRNLCEGIY